MGAQTKITISHDKAEVANDLQSKFMTASNGKFQFFNALEMLLDRVATGVSNGTITTVIDNGDGVASTGTLTLAGVVAADTCVVGSQTFTCVASGATGNQFNVGANDTATAVNLAAVISSVLSNVVTATSSGTVVTVTASVSGVIGNQVQLTGNAHITASGAYLASGAQPTGGASVTYKEGV